MYHGALGRKKKSKIFFKKKKCQGDLEHAHFTILSRNLKKNFNVQILSQGKSKF